MQSCSSYLRIREWKGMKGNIQNWFKCFKDGDLSLKIKSRNGLPSVVDYNALKFIEEEKPDYLENFEKN